MTPFDYKISLETRSEKTRPDRGAVATRRAKACNLMNLFIIFYNFLKLFPQTPKDPVAIFLEEL
jgi:hypothetical protein